MGQSIGRALIVEDDPLLNNILNEAVEEMGFSVTAATDLEDARRAFDGMEYDVVVADLKLNGDERAGLQLAGEVIQRHAGTRIVMVSGYPQPEHLAANVTFLRKPFTLAQLQQVLASQTLH